MDFFPKTLKLYHFWERDGVSLGIKASDSYVLSFYFEASKFHKMIKDCYLDSGYEDDLYFIQVKKKFVRFSKQGPGFTTHLRIGKEPWSKLIAEYNEKFKNPLGEYFSCEID